MNCFAELSVSQSAEFFRYFFCLSGMRELESSPIIKVKAHQISSAYLEFGMLLQYQNEDIIKQTYKTAKWNFSNIELYTCTPYEISTCSPVTYKIADL